MASLIGHSQREHFTSQQTSKPPLVAALDKWGVMHGGVTRGLAAYASNVSFGQPERCFLTVWTPKSLCQDLLMMTFLRR